MKSDQEAVGFTEPQTNALVMPFDPLVTKQDLQGAIKAIRNDLRWLKGVIGATGLAVLADLVIGLFL